MAESVGFISLGCAKNLVDSQIMAGYLKSGQIELAAAPEQADIILINTCAFIDIAREEAAEVILSACAHKAAGGCSRVIVAGCMVQRYRERMTQAFPDVDAFLGIDELDQIVTLLDDLRQECAKPVRVAKGEPVKLFDPIYPTLLFSGGPFAYLKISEGCNHRCAYCSIPNIRGSFRSRTTQSVYNEAAAMVLSGVRELNVISQDTLNYGSDSGGESRIEQLLEQLDALDGDFWIRLLYGYPSSVSDALLDLLADSRHLVRYLDLPVQHSHPDILHAMNRAHAVEATQNLTERLRTCIPGLVLRTTCLVGFPGETDSHFEHLLQYVQRSRFDHLGVFVFSPEEGTAAFDMDNVPPLEVAERRRDELLRVQRDIVRKRLAKLRGAREKLLLLRRRGNIWKGRLPRQAPEVDGETVVAGVPDSAQPGDFVPVQITGFNGYDLKAQYGE